MLAVKPVSIKNVFGNSRTKKWRLFLCTLSFVVSCIVPLLSYAHPSPNSLVFLDVNSERVSMEIQLPLPELQLSFGNEISKNPETLLQRVEPLIMKYLTAHIHAYVSKERPWGVEITELKMDKGKYVDSDIPYWELVAHVLLKPHPGETTRKFTLDYDVIMHQVINHIALVSIRSDWETGNLQPKSTEATVIQWNVADNRIYPLEVNLEKGSWFKGFKAMVSLGMEHIKEGTDHLLFLLVLLLPAMLLINAKNWGEYGGIRYSVVKLLKIITAFTIGHSTTLLVGALGWVKLSAQPVEILIAFSILISAIHAVYPIFPGKEMYVAAGFGLIHGLAFATILSNLKLGAGTLAMSILGFNLGIEFMQLFIVLIIIPWLILLSKTQYYKWFRVLGAMLAASAASAWMAERISGKSNFITLLVTKVAQYGFWLVIALVAVSIISYVVANTSSKYFKV